MTQSIEALTTATLSLALSAAGQRHQAIAANLANAGAHGYAPVRIAFESHLADARQALRDKGSVDAQSLAAVRVELEPDVDASGQPVPVQLDAAMVEMARNAVHYQALTQGLSRHLAIHALAVADGKR
ncbi:MAG: flagellar basal body protein [Ramlibacter sp.]|jgi:flagellar basal-body rod protein FlgB|uniref:flagellar basal body protein n=1 Tax=Ramlibacter sp. TaxID=1917967 RepID=UPI00262D52AE|nr:flagellar basal body protein [Ramlibacter sp.]MDB5750680.1 flagellar basal body protein [Ramlibacter sp.]